MNDQREPRELHARATVAVAVSAGDVAAQLTPALTAMGFAVVAARDIAHIVTLTDQDERLVAIVDDSGSGWLREVSDLLRLRPNARPLALIQVQSAAELLAAVSAGVAGFVSPDADPEAVARTVRALVDTGVAIPRGLVAALVEEVRGRGRSVNTDAGPIDVTEREWEILQLMLQRRSTREIAEMLYVSVGTVRSHISALGRKLGAADREHTIRLLERRRG